MHEFQSFINKRKTKDLVIFRKRNVDKLFRVFINEFPVVKAAGGLVVNEYNMVLMIYKNGTWDLPKGKREKKENNKKTALREVAEETGIDNLYILRKLPKTYHFFQSRNSWQIKKTHWYLMKAESMENASPCLAEGITRVSWFSREDIQRLESESYRSVKALIGYGLDLL